MSDAARRDDPAANESAGSQRRWRPKVLVAAGLALLLVAGLTIAGLTGRDNQAPQAQGGAGADGTQSAGTTGKPSDAVRGYLEALAARDADRAVGYLEPAPSRRFLTPKVLQASAKKVPLSGVDVPELTGEDTAQVPADYSLGRQRISERYSVVKADGRWKIARGVSELDLTEQRKQALPLRLRINGVSLATDTAVLFPGHYTFSTSSKWVGYGTGAAFVLTGPSDPASPRLVPTLRPGAEAAFLRATKKAMDACLAQRKLSPSGCPNRLKADSNQKVDEDTIRWTLTNDPYADAQVTHSREDPTVVEATLKPRYNFRAEGTQDGRRATFDGPPTGLSSVVSTGDLSKDTISVRLSAS
nr:hypothetical protein [uncultured Friedmanniella sp.]